MNTPRAQHHTIGLLGGMSWESSAEYYRIANTLVRENLGGLHSARLIMSSVDFAEIADLQNVGAWDEAGDMLAAQARGLESAGADMVLICTNTMHKVADQVAAAVTVPLLHVCDVVADAVRADHLNSPGHPPTVGLLGTRFTMEDGFYQAHLARHGVRTLVPDSSEREWVHRIIFDELCQGVLSADSRHELRQIMARLADAGAQGIILGCTEIELLVGADDSPVPVYPTARLHIDAALRSTGVLLPTHAPASASAAQ